MKNFFSIFNFISQNLRLSILIIGFVCILSYGLTLNMYFWKDDFAVMIKAAHPQEAVGFLGPGLKGEGAYSYVATPFIFLYPTFGLDAFWYFLVGLILYFLSAISVLLFSREILKDNFKGLLVGLVYSSGYIGADSIYGLMNSYQTSWITISLCFSLILFFRYFQNGGIFKYILSLLLFYFSLETGYIRAHGFFLIILSTAFLVIKKVNFKELFWFGLKTLPFLLIFRKFYLTNVTASVGSSRLTQAFTDKNFDYFLNPLITISQLIFPTHLINWIRNVIDYLIGKNVQEEKVYLLLLIVFSILNILILIKAWLTIKKYTSIKTALITDLRLLFFGVSAAVGSFIGVFYIAAASSYLGSTHRYLSTALIGLAFYWVALLSILSVLFYKEDAVKQKNKRLILSGSLIIICSYLILSNIYSAENIYWRTDPQKKFFVQMKNQLPSISEKSSIYIDHSNKYGTHTKLGQIFGTGMVGGSPEIAVHYGVDRYSISTTIGNFNDFVGKFKSEKGSIENSYAFYFEDNKLTNYSKDFREVLKNGKTKKINISELGLKGLENYTHVVELVNDNGQLNLKNSSFEINFPQNIFSLTNAILKFDLQIISEEPKAEIASLRTDDQIYLEYLYNKPNIKNNIEARVLNHFQNNIWQNLFDGKKETTWMADRGPWHNIIHGIVKDSQFIDLHLKNPINFGGLLFTNGHALRTPVGYKILIKENGLWREIKRIENGLERAAGENWFEKVEPIITQDIRLEITSSSSGDAPQLAELEPVDQKFSSLDFEKALQIELDPTILLKQYPDSPTVMNYFAENGQLSFTYLSNKDNDYNVPNINFKIQGLNQIKTYEIPIAANGTYLVKAKFFNLNFPGKYIFRNFEMVNPPLNYYLEKL